MSSSVAVRGWCKLTPDTDSTPVGVTWFLLVLSKEMSVFYIFSGYLSNLPEPNLHELWSLFVTFDLMNMWRVPSFCKQTKLVLIGLCLLNEVNFTFWDHHWPCFMTFDSTNTKSFHFVSITWKKKTAFCNPMWQFCYIVN